MWFKNIQVYRFTKTFELNAEEIAERLEQHEFVPCNSQQPASSGWTAPLGRQGNDFVHSANGYVMVCSKNQEKLLPASVVNEELEAKVMEIEESQSRKVSRKERTTLKEEITFNLLPLAFARSRLDFAYLALHEGLLILNSSSEKKADEFVSNLRKALATLPVIPLESNYHPTDIMTHWVKSGQTTHDFDLGEECELRLDSEAASVIRCKNQDLSTAEILSHLKTGMQVTKLALSWKDRLEFILDEQLSIKRIRFTDVMQEEMSQNSESAEDKATRFDIDFTLMTLEYAAFIATLIEAFGGVRDQDLSAASAKPEKTTPNTSVDLTPESNASSQPEVA